MTKTVAKHTLIYSSSMLYKFSNVEIYTNKYSNNTFIFYDMWEV